MPNEASNYYSLEKILLELNQKYNLFPETQAWIKSHVYELFDALTRRGNLTKEAERSQKEILTAQAAMENAMQDLKYKLQRIILIDSDTLKPIIDKLDNLTDPWVVFLKNELNKLLDNRNFNESSKAMDPFQLRFTLPEKEFQIGSDEQDFFEL